MKRLFGFTLAETLIVMGIIGVVAALTLPNLNSATGDKEKVAKLQKIYSNLQDAFSRAESVYGPLDEWCANISNNDTACITKVMTRVSDFLKVSKDCGYSGDTNETGNGCFIVSGNEGFVISAGYTLILADGASIKVERGLGTCHNIALSSITSDVPEKCVLCEIDVDIDGPNKGSNMPGKDIFSFYITKQGIVAAGSENELTDATLKTNCFSKGGQSPRCTAWILKSGNMDYLKADSNGKCPNNIQLSWSNTSCK